jgi:hypothetical protein
MEKVHMKKSIFFSFVLFLSLGVYPQNHPNDLVEIHYDNDYVNAIGSANTDFIIAAKFNQYILAPFYGKSLAQVKVYINNPTAGNLGVVKIYGAGYSITPGDLLYSSSPVHVNSNSWNIIPIPVLVTIPESDLWIGFEATSGPSGSHSWAGCDSGPNDPDGQYIFYGGSWRLLTALGASFTYNWNIRAVIETITQVEPENLPVRSSLQQNYPNPFNPNTTINFSLSSNSWVNLKVYNIIGQEIVTLINCHILAGDHNVNFNADKLTAGIYVYKLTASAINGTQFTSVKKMILMK